MPDAQVFEMSKVVFFAFFFVGVLLPGLHDMRRLMSHTVRYPMWSPEEIHELDCMIPLEGVKSLCLWRERGSERRADIFKSLASTLKEMAPNCAFHVLEESQVFHGPSA